MAAIEIKNLKFKYDKDSTDYVLDDFSLSINKGEYVTIVGHNGSGKSTLAKLIMGLLKKESGEIIIFDKVADKKSIYDIRADIGIVFQNPDNQFIGATVRDDIAFGLENRCVPHEDMEDIIKEYAEKVDMVEFLDKEPSSLSGGQKQRVAIAGVLAMKPKIIILDEATAMLDPRGKREIIDLIHKLKKEQEDLTILSITHDLEEAAISDRCIVIDGGKVLFNDIPDNVFSHEEELLKAQLDIPFKNKIISLLAKENINVGICDTLESLEDKLCQ